MTLGLRYLAFVPAHSPFCKQAPTRARRRARTGMKVVDSLDALSKSGSRRLGLFSKQTTQVQVQQLRAGSGIQNHRRYPLDNRLHIRPVGSTQIMSIAILSS